jgi:hypothetical protein
LRDPKKCAEILQAWESALGEKLFPVEHHIGGRAHLGGVYGTDYAARAKGVRLTDEQEKWAREAWRTARKNAGTRRIEFSLTAEQVARLLRRSDGRCEITGIPLSLEREGRTRSPWRPSLDRIKSEAGYSFGNCRVVCCAVNLAMNEWGVSVLDKLARAYVSKHS